MALIASFLPGIQVVISILLIGAILLQQRGAGMGGAFGDSSQGTYYKRRGAELFLFRASIVLSVLFALTALLQLLVS
ncbi:preprotein translocase subunit SecG [Patescibacteria group bacterium]|nr:preprotein translocase subunit SecG [Patescibacteria group bacterium]